MSRRYIPDDGVLRVGFYWTKRAEMPEAEIAFWNGYRWYVAGMEDPLEGLIPISRKLEAPR